MSESPEKRKVIIDEDWKTKVQREKEALQQPAADGGTPGAESAEPKPGTPPKMEIPEASFSLLLTTLATQALAALGQVAPPDAKEVPVDLKLAKHLIDTMEILEQKTKGNLTNDESQLLGQMLYELRMVFVATRNQVEQTGQVTPGT